MMGIRRVGTVCLAILMSVSLAAQQAPAKKDEKKRSKQELAELEQIIKLVDGVMAGQPAPTDVQLSLEPYFLKSVEPRSFVPFVLTVVSPPAADAALFVRVVNPASQPDPKAKKVEYPWEDTGFVSAAQLAGGKLNRAFMATAGTYDVYVAVRERLPEKAPKTQVPKMGVLKATVVVPDFFNAELNTSSILVTDKVIVLNAPITPEEARERPFVLGLQELVPASDADFKKSEELAVFFQVYNPGLDAAGKPNLSMEYEFHRKDGDAEKFFNKTSPQLVNASNLPPQFDPVKYQIPGGIAIPLASFPEGDYRLAIKVTDKASGKSLTRDVRFTVKAS